MDDKNPVIDADGNKSWYKNGELHRIDGPAIEWADGYKEWWLNGKLHRIDCPAFEWRNGNKEWYVNGKRHRTDGPAVELNKGKKEWYLNDKELSSELFLKLTQGDIKDLPLHLGIGFDSFISERLRSHGE